MSERKLLDPKYDAVFKKLFGSDLNKGITRRFIEDVIGIYISNLTFIDPYLTTDVVGHSKLVVDITCTTSDGREVLIEIQKCYQRSFAKRMLFYGCKIFSSQLKIGETNYPDCAKKIKDVFVIAIANFPLCLSNTSHISIHKMLNTETYENEMEGLSFHFIDLSKFTVEKTEIEKLENSCDVWCYFLKHIHYLQENDVNALMYKYPRIAEAILELQKIQLTPEENDQYVVYSAAALVDNEFSEYAKDLANHRVEEALKAAEIETAEKLRQVEIETAEKLRQDKIKTAKKLLVAGIPIEIVCSSTNLKQDDLNIE